MQMLHLRSSLHPLLRELRAPGRCRLEAHAAWILVAGSWLQSPKLQLRITLCRREPQLKLAVPTAMLVFPLPRSRLTVLTARKQDSLDANA